MPRAGTGDLINGFLGSTQVFASAVRNVVEEKLLREIAPRQLTFSQFRLLKLVAMTNAQTLGDVATFLGVSNAAASKAVDKLVRRGLLLRSEAEADRRAIELSLTEPSHRLLAAYEAAKNRTLAKVFRQLSPKDLRHTAELLDQLSAMIVDHTARAEEICLQCGIYYRKKCLIRQLVQRNCFYHRHKTRENAPADARSKASP